jgi:hypothetical protein
MFLSRCPYSVRADVGKLHQHVFNGPLRAPPWPFELFVSALTGSPAKGCDVLAALSHQTNFSVGCYCAEEFRCHRSVLRQLLVEHGAHVV